jgi:hypothetical protein
MLFAFHALQTTFARGVQLVRGHGLSHLQIVRQEDICQSFPQLLLMVSVQIVHRACLEVTGQLYVVVLQLVPAFCVLLENSHWEV